MLLFLNRGLYKMILQSRKPKAEKFQDWVTEDLDMLDELFSVASIVCAFQN